MNVLQTGLAVVLVSIAMLSPGTAFANETTIIGAHLVTSDQCLVAQMPASSDDGDGAQVLGGLAPILAGIGGEVVGTLFNGLGQAIQAAAAEHAYSATGSTGFFAGEFVRESGSTTDAWTFEHKPQCLILAVFSNDRAARGNTIQALGGDVTSIEGLNLPIDGGLAALLEIAMIPEQDGIRFETLGVHYLAPIGDAGLTAGNVDVVIELATPSFNAGDGEAPPPRDQLGNRFALLHYKLPTIRPRPGEQSLTASELGGIGSIWVPRTPETGLIETRLETLNGIESTYASSLRSFDSARTDVLAEDAGATEAAALRIASHALFDACLEYVRLRGESLDQCGTENAPEGPAIDYPSVTGVEGGAVNARVSFIVTREPNLFLQAIGDAMADSSRQDAIQTYVTGQIHSEDDPAWSEADTEYLAAMLVVRQREADLTAAQEGDDPSAIQAAELEFLKAKGAANVAAIAAGENLPFPDLLSSLTD